MQNILIIGGTRNMGHDLALRLNAEGQRVTILNRGISPDDLPDSIARLRADRTDTLQLRRALLAKRFDVVVDFVVYNGTEAQAVAEILHESCGHYILISSGQVYLVREGLSRPFVEDDYPGRLLPAPKLNTYAYEEWYYGMGKREAEDSIQQAHERRAFPYTTLRLPMVNSERDQQRRLYNYILRLRDGHPLLIPETPDYPLRHIDSADVTAIISQMIQANQPHNRAFNLSQEETLSLDEFLGLLGQMMGVAVNAVRARTSDLEAGGFMPHCSPFSERWMSELDNTLSKEVLHARYTPLAETLERLLRYYRDNPPPTPAGYKRRHAEVQFARHLLKETP